MPRTLAAVACLCFLMPFCFAQTVTELMSLRSPSALEFSTDGNVLHYRFGDQGRKLSLAANSRPEADPTYLPPPAQKSRTSPDGTQIASLESEARYGPPLLFLRSAASAAPSRPLSKMPILAFQWAADSRSLWVIGVVGPDNPVGQVTLDGRFVSITHKPAMRVQGGLAFSDHALAWVENDPSQFGAIWLRDRTGKTRCIFDPNPQTRAWSRQWNQRVISWKNAHGEQLQGVLVTPANGGRSPLIVDPYSSWSNRFLNIPVLANYAFVKAGYAVFFPNHRAAHAFPAMSMGEAYVGASKDRDPVDVLTDDVMSGVSELVRRGAADPQRLFLYSFSTGASAIDQLLTRTEAFKAAVSGGGVADWLGYYQRRHPLGDETIPGFLGGRTPESSAELYRSISPVNFASRIHTPLLLVVGQKDTRRDDTVAFYDALHAAGAPATLVIYPDAAHEIPTAELAEEHVRKALGFFRSATGR